MLVTATTSYAEKEEGKGQTVENLIELAERAKERTETRINVVELNLAAMNAVMSTGLDAQLADNLTLFDKGVVNVTNAYLALEEGDYEGAIANATEALSVFREVFKAVNTILAEAGVQGDQLVDGQGLIQAMERILESIDRLSEIGESPEEATSILSRAKLHLDVTQATKWLQMGMVDQIAHNLSQAKKLISQAHEIMKGKAVQLTSKRIENYLKVIEDFYDRLERQIDKAIHKWPNAQNLKHRLANEVNPLIDDAKTLFAPGGPDRTLFQQQTLAKLQEARDALRAIEQDLTKLRT